MDINQLKYFQRVAKLQHMTKAAEELSISQAALSQSIQNLENELGVELFERVGRNIVLSKYGSIYLKHVETALDALSNSQKELLALKKRNENMINLIAPTFFGFPGLFSRICKECKSKKISKLSVYDCTAEEILLALKNGEADLCITQKSLPTENERIVGIELRKFALGALVSRQSIFASRDSVDMLELAQCEFAGFPENTGPRENMMRVCAQFGWTPNVTFESSSYSDIVRAVATNRYISIVVPVIAGNYESFGVRHVKLNAPNSSVSLKLYWNGFYRLKPLANTLKQVFIDYFKEDSNFL